MSDLDGTEKVVTILTPYANDTGARAGGGPGTRILDDLNASSARLGDVVLASEDELGIESGDDDVDTGHPLGHAVPRISIPLA